MIRAGIFVGVDQTGGLTTLQDAAAGAERMYNWALSQGMSAETHAKLITDKAGAEVSPYTIYQAIDEIVQGAGVDQLIVYFAGHGIYNFGSEQWLLTGAPRQSWAAVNVVSSADLAGRCGIRHVVLISDTCRVAPEGIQAAGVRGVEIFPNDTVSARAKPVDQFFACIRGTLSNEVQDPTLVASNFTALYTQTMLEVFSGIHPDLVERAIEGDNSGLIRPKPLGDFLEREIPRRIRRMKLTGKVNQEPEAIVMHHENWIAKVPIMSSRRRGSRARVPKTEPTPRSVDRSLFRAVLRGDLPEISDKASVASSLTETVERLIDPFGPDHFETQCGIKVRGSRIVDAFAPALPIELLGGTLVRVSTSAFAKPAASVILELDGGIGVAVPVLPGFLAALTVDDGNLVDMAYEPSVNSSEWNRYQSNLSEVRTLRAVAAASTRRGTFQLNEEDAEFVASRMQRNKSIDPTLAIYAAYAYQDLQLTEKIIEMSSYLRSQLHVELFDVALLGRLLIAKSVNRSSELVPFVPLMTRGWSLIRPHGVKLHPKLNGIESTVRNAVWSTYTEQGLEKLRDTLATGDVL